MIRAWGRAWAKAKKLRGVFMRLGNDANAPVLDLVQFIDPPTQGQPYPTLNNVVSAVSPLRLTTSTRPTSNSRAKKVDFVAPLKKIEGPNDNQIGVVCFKDPDGTILELISGM